VSGDIDLANVNWGNYDLVVIDESHNFRNKGTPKQGGETRYDRLMKRIIQQGVRTRVLMLSATPVNNRMADLRNQIVFATEGDDTALRHHGISSIDATTRLAQQRFNAWLKLEDARRTPARLIEMIGFDYFTMLDQLTIARSRKHIEKYYGTAETGTLPRASQAGEHQARRRPGGRLPVDPRGQRRDPAAAPGLLHPTELRPARQTRRLRREVQHRRLPAARESGARLTVRRA
jgi:SNF2 family DNA or RNA helicase